MGLSRRWKEEAKEFGKITYEESVATVYDKKNIHVDLETMV